MRQIRLWTTVDVVPRPNLSEHWYKITRGETANIQFNLSDKAYTFETVKQLTFRFTHPIGQIYVFNYYDVNGNKDYHFDEPLLVQAIDDDGSLLTYKYINLTLTPEDTRQFLLANKENPIQLEVILELESDQEERTGEPYIVIEKQLPVIVSEQRTGALYV